jgi:type I restriction enzyme S subunit
MTQNDRKLNVHGVKSIPAEWKTVHLKDVIDPKRPITYGVVVPGEFCENGTLLIRAKDHSNAGPNLLTCIELVPISTELTDDLWRNH